MRTSLSVMMLLGIYFQHSQAQSMFVPKVEVQGGTTTSVRIPNYLVYRHFMGWVNDLNNKSVAAHATDAYDFAKPFERAQLEHSHVDALLREARSLEADLAGQDARAKALVTDFRQRAQSALQAGDALPPAPPELDRLQTARTANLIQHMLKLQRTLGPEKTAQLDAYMQREIVPHISAKQFVQPPAKLVN